MKQKLNFMWTATACWVLAQTNQFPGRLLAPIQWDPMGFVRNKKETQQSREGWFECWSVVFLLLSIMSNEHLVKSHEWKSLKFWNACESLLLTCLRVFVVFLLFENSLEEARIEIWSRLGSLAVDLFGDWTRSFLVYRFPNCLPTPVTMLSSWPTLELEEAESGKWLEWRWNWNSLTLRSLIVSASMTMKVSWM